MLHLAQDPFERFKNFFAQEIALQNPTAEPANRPRGRMPVGAVPNLPVLCLGVAPPPGLLLSAAECGCVARTFSHAYIAAAAWLRAHRLRTERRLSWPSHAVWGALQGVLDPFGSAAHRAAQADRPPYRQQVPYGLFSTAGAFLEHGNWCATAGALAATCREALSALAAGLREWRQDYEHFLRAVEPRPWWDEVLRRTWRWYYARYWREAAALRRMLGGPPLRRRRKWAGGSSTDSESYDAASPSWSYTSTPGS